MFSNKNQFSKNSKSYLKKSLRKSLSIILCIFSNQNVK
ncbi:hypothetical protein LEP1GSC151_4680 [Leptospira interrogans serovar Grippotyphosa str. LT2186]|uniref:Uncharacterized protein n=3 Tax=Leptospira interrogans TaxID=173 RepID=M3HK91_LEPIR|nr:hypothetical protein LEP1GSC077_2516 [Leptospira interrogans str. C10069]EKO72106.1 hypothetical protein LEP1GSC069_0971 [Leptospira interrogans serovar Canicola str. Fiocruz LV133]EKR45548.1 hypothetical protein LEP1GSC097_4405 [Leptospira interrogans serovar Grippotyphosa str. UI 08368]EMG13055.1 hypothetical protein LEP1GSC151_4680 [Leptospira interrogans serovar Grippotyphosa str. LT2186]EMM82176.1 hypothetical protein LEP1GSC037_2617 [Leptospira interrogans str. 2006001854]EMN28126.1 h